MQKIYSRIDWENEPSTNTPLSESNLNKMDYALDQIDNRVVQLAGYQDRVAQSEKNAKTSEENAKVSETNAKQSELKSKEYMESAFKGTPEGYQEVVEKVDSMEIKTTKENTIKGTKNGGFRLTKFVANTIQNGTPSPITPIPMLSTGDCVEMIQGLYSVSNGAYQSSTTEVCTKNKIPCKSGDIVKIKTEQYSTIYVLLFNGNTFSTSLYSSGLTEHTFTIPSGCDSFHYRVSLGGSTITPQTAGKITITINGKYLCCVRTKDENGNETSAYFLTDYPMIKGSTLFRENGLVKAMHCAREKEINGNVALFGITEKETGNVHFAIPEFGVDAIPCDNNNEYTFSDYLSTWAIDTNGGIWTEIPKTVLAGVDANSILAWFSEHLPKVQYPLATPIIETLDTQSQIALNGLETFEGVTYVEFDSRVQPLEFEAEVGTSQVGAYTLHAMNVAESNAVRINELAVAMVSL